MPGDGAIKLAELHEAQRRAVADFGDPPDALAGRGIVTSIYDREFPSCWVLLRELVAPEGAAAGRGVASVRMS